MLALERSCYGQCALGLVAGGLSHDRLRHYSTPKVLSICVTLGMYLKATILRPAIHRDQESLAHLDFISDSLKMSVGKYESLLQRPPWHRDECAR